MSDLDLALRMADAADAITLDRFRAADLRVSRKPDRTPVTDADTAVEKALRAMLDAERAGDAVLGEEEGGSVDGAERGWVIDPIDGTKNFSRGIPVWATLIGLTTRGSATVGVASAPALGRRWWAASGEGAWVRDGAGTRRIAVSGVTDLADAFASTTDSRGLGERWARLGSAVWETRAFGDFWQHCMVAEGALDIAVDAGANPWDLAALVPIVREAGGRLSSMAGRDGFTGGDGLSTNGALHPAALALLS